jgi:ADP-ribosylglycohydrolase
VGEVILHGKKHLWGRSNRHYHHGLQSGDNTLNLLCVRVLMRSMNARGRYDSQAFLQAYVEFMTTPGSHNDTYAESYHRDFFANYARGVPPERCAGNEGHDTASIGGLVALPPVIFATLRDTADDTADEMILKHLRLTHRSGKLEIYARALSRLFRRIVADEESNLRPLFCTVAESLGFPATKVLQRIGSERRSDLEVIGGMLSSACYIDQSFPAVLYLAARYSDAIEAALIANANAGGDNCHRGAVLGALLGSALGPAAIPDRWVQGLRDREQLEQEIDGFAARFA